MEFLSREEFSSYLLSVAEKNGFSSLLDSERIDRFYTLTHHMLSVNEQMNLTAIREEKKCILLHYADSLVGAKYFPDGATVIDVGCGAGFPSLPLSICRPDLSVTAMDATAKRVRYVAECATLLGLSNLNTLTGRAEELAKSKDYRERFDCATARAVAALPVLSELCLPFVKVGGLFVAMKGRAAEEELAASRHALSALGGAQENTVQAPLLSPDGEQFDHTSLLIRKTKPTPPLYPRAYGKITKSPL